MRSKAYPLGLLTLLFGAIVLGNLVLASWYVAHGDIHFSSDISRDFLLLQELDQKKLVLIGPRSSTGLFHGPLWLYLNYPAFALGAGNPVMVGWFWVGLIGVFVLSGYLIARNLFGKFAAILYTLMISLYMGFHGFRLFNPHGAMMVLPGFFYTFVRYRQTSDVKYLLLHFVLAGLLIQFQMAIGIPFVILSAAAILIGMLRKRHVRHVWAFLVIPAMLTNFIVFDLRHDFLLSRLVGDFLSTSQGGQPFNYLTFAGERLWLMLSATEILRVDPGKRNLLLTLFLFIVIGRQLLDRKHRAVYLWFFYFYIGYFVLSLIDKGPLLYFYLFPVFPLVFLVFTSLVTSRWRTLFLVVFAVVYVFNIQAALRDTQGAKTSIGIDRYSWKFLDTLAQAVYSGPEEEFGYFVFAPDAFGYEPKYAMAYRSRISSKMAVANQKRPVTYVINIPHPYWTSDWWKATVLHINRPANSVVRYPNGYTVDQYLFTEEELAVPTESNVDPGIHFR